MKTKLSMWLIVFALMLLPGKALAQYVWTPWASKYILQLFVTSDYYYIVDTTGNWGVCTPAAVQVRISRAEPNARDLLALLLTARAGGFPISIYGICTGSYFDTNYIVLN